eukprot:scaffold18_cov401-Prasinococcus_capsulatus_cf.AAC.19
MQDGQLVGSLERTELAMPGQDIRLELLEASKPLTLAIEECFHTAAARAVRANRQPTVSVSIGSWVHGRAGPVAAREAGGLVKREALGGDQVEVLAAIEHRVLEPAPGPLPHAPGVHRERVQRHREAAQRTEGRLRLRAELRRQLEVARQAPACQRLREELLPLPGAEGHRRRAWQLAAVEADAVVAAAAATQVSWSSAAGRRRGCGGLCGRGDEEGRRRVAEAAGAAAHRLASSLRRTRAHARGMRGDPASCACTPMSRPHERLSAPREPARELAATHAGSLHDVFAHHQSRGRTHDPNARHPARSFCARDARRTAPFVAPSLLCPRARAMLEVPPPLPQGSHLSNIRGSSSGTLVMIPDDDS